MVAEIVGQFGFHDADESMLSNMCRQGLCEGLCELATVWEHRSIPSGRLLAVGQEKAKKRKTRRKEKKGGRRSTGVTVMHDFGCVPLGVWPRDLSRQPRLGQGRPGSYPNPNMQDDNPYNKFFHGSSSYDPSSQMETENPTRPM